MNANFRIIVWLVLLTLTVGSAKSIAAIEIDGIESRNDTKCFYQNPAEKWDEGFPIGNGYIGAMVLGTLPQERIALNHGRLWREKKLKDRENPKVAHHLPMIRQMFFEGKIIEASEAAIELLGVQQFNEALGERRSGPDPFQPVGDLLISFPGHEDATGYRRELDLSTGIATVTYVYNGVTYSRDVFASRTDGVIVVRISADKPGSISSRIELSRIEDPDCTITPWAKGDRIGFVGEFVENVRFAAEATVLTKGGQLLAVNEGAAQINIEKADEVLILVCIATDKETNDSKAYCSSHLDKVSQKADFTAMVKSHALDHQRLFNRANLSFGEDPRSDIPIDQRLSQIKTGEPDLGLVSLYFHLGRYLLISSSRPGGVAANLRGIWNDVLEPPWSGDYHYDFNVQMNYWPAEVCNLSECAEPFFDHVEQSLPAARVAAKNLYDCRGIYIPLTNDAALKCLKTEGRWSEWTGAAAWVAQHFWWHWEFTGDEDFLRHRAYPLYKEIGLFYQDYLVKDPREDSPHYGKLVTVPSQSPENFFVGGTEPVSLCIGATMDFQLIYEVFTNLIDASKILNVDADKRPEWQYVLDNIPPLQVGRHGQLQEWLEDYEEGEVQHRHRSHLYAVYPGDQITIERTPRLARAAYVSVERRIQGSPRYEASAGGLWMAGIWSRFEEPDMAEVGVRAEIARCGPNIVRYRTIEKNYGIPAVIAEMLLQSHNGVIKLLPALPKAWPTGQVKGLRARGGFEVDIAWQDGELTQAKIKSLIGRDCRIRSASPLTVEISGTTVKTSEVESAIFEFSTRSGNVYTLTP